MIIMINHQGISNFFDGGGGGSVTCSVAVSASVIVLLAMNIGNLMLAVSLNTI